MGNFNFDEIKTLKILIKYSQLLYEQFEPFIEKRDKAEENIFLENKHFCKIFWNYKPKNNLFRFLMKVFKNCHTNRERFVIVFNNHRDSNLFKFRNLRLEEIFELYESFGTKFGDLSAILIEKLTLRSEELYAK